MTTSPEIASPLRFLAVVWATQVSSNLKGSFPADEDFHRSTSKQNVAAIPRRRIDLEGTRPKSGDLKTQ